MLIAGSTRHIGSETLVWTIYFESLKPSLHFIKCVCVCNVHANVILSCTQLRLALIRLLLCTISLQLGSVGLSSEQLVSLQFTSPATCSKAKHCILQNLAASLPLSIHQVQDAFTFHNSINSQQPPHFTILSGGTAGRCSCCAERFSLLVGRRVFGVQVPILLRSGLRSWEVVTTNKMDIICQHLN